GGDGVLLSFDQDRQEPARSLETVDAGRGGIDCRPASRVSSNGRERQTIVIAVPPRHPTRMSRPTRGSRQPPPSRRVQPTMLSGQRQRTSGSSAMYSSQTSPASNSPAAAARTKRFHSPLNAAM